MRILSLDGGPSPLVTVRILRELEKRYPGFLRRVDMFCGTSNGAFISLYLALALTRGRTGLEAIDECIDFSNEVTRAFKLGPRNYARLMSGALSMLDGRKLQQTLERYYGKHTRLVDLKRPVAISVFDATKSELTTYHPFTPDGDGTATLVDVALASSSFPVLFPGFRPSSGPRKGHLLLDGALSSNSSAMVGLSDALLYLFDEDDDLGVDHRSLNPSHGLQRVSLLSLGSTSKTLEGFNSLDRFLDRRMLSAGLQRPEFGWLRLLITSLHGVANLVEGTTASDDYYARQMLGARRYYRFQPSLPSLSLLTGILLKPEKVLVEAERLASELWQQEQVCGNRCRQRKLMPWEVEQQYCLLHWIEQFWLREPPRVASSLLAAGLREAASHEAEGESPQAGRPLKHTAS